MTHCPESPACHDESYQKELSDPGNKTAAATRQYQYAISTRYTAVSVAECHRTQPVVKHPSCCCHQVPHSPAQSTSRTATRQATTNPLPCHVQNDSRSPELQRTEYNNISVNEAGGKPRETSGPPTPTRRHRNHSNGAIVAKHDAYSSTHTAQRRMNSRARTHLGTPECHKR